MKGKSIALWVINALLALVMVGAGFAKVSSNPEAVANFARGNLLTGI